MSQNYLTMMIANQLLLTSERIINGFCKKWDIAPLHPGICKWEGVGALPPNIFKFARKLVKSQPCYHAARELATVFCVTFF